jgi:hypothetical protein
LVIDRRQPVLGCQGPKLSAMRTEESGVKDTRRASTPWRAMAAKARSKSSGPATSTRCTWTPTARAAVSTRVKGVPRHEQQGHAGYTGNGFHEQLQVFSEEFHA